MAETLLVGDGTVVAFHYRLTNDAGDVLDSSEGSEPLTYLQGSGNIVPGLERQLTGHLTQLTEAAAQAEDPCQRLEAVLDAYALIQHEFREAHRGELAAHLHQATHVARAQQQLRELVRDLLAAAAAAGQIRGDVAADELAAFCLHALAAATSLPSKAAVRRLVQVTLTGLRAPMPSGGQERT